MSQTQQTSGRIRVSFSQFLGLALPYMQKRLVEQIKSVAIIVAYLVLFQTIVLRIALADAGIIACGLGLVVAGLAFFMEGLMLGLMPLGEVIGVRLPRKSKLPVIILFSFVLGVGATFAEPAIGVLKAAGASVCAWEAPLLFLLLNRFSNLLVYAVGAGVGIAVVFGMLRFIYGWSLKPFVYVLTGILMLLSIWSFFDPNMRFITGLAWDCGGVTTGPVTVPLVLALGIGISRVVGKAGQGAGGFGVVTLASLFPILMVMLLGLPFLGKVPAPMSEDAFFSAVNHDKALYLLGTEDALKNYRITCAAADPSGVSAAPLKVLEILSRNTLAALQAILPLSLFLVFVLLVVVREKLPRADEIALGVVFAVIGMSLFSIGIEQGLGRIGSQIGGKLPASFTAIALPEKQITIAPFDTALVQTAIGAEGRAEKFFFLNNGSAVQTVPYEPGNLDAEKRYRHVPHIGPLFGPAGGILGLMVVLIFAFVMGYGATLAEPALNALGITVEELTVGTFKKNVLMQAVAAGVGTGIMFGVAKLLWDIPLVWLLIPPYAIVIVLTALSTEEFVNIGWDSAGVTTGPVTVPLVLALGLGIGGQLGLTESFGILALASVWPILTVLLLGLILRQRRRKQLGTGDAAAEGGAA